MKKILNLKEPNIVNVLEKNYRKLTYGGSTRYKSKMYKFLEDEFHPLWHTFRVGDDYCELKVNNQVYNIECNDQLDCSDYIWFNVKASSDCVIAVCQLNSDIKFLLYGKPSTSLAKRIVEDTLNVLA